MDPAPASWTAAALCRFSFAVLVLLTLLGLATRAAAQGAVPNRMTFQGFMEDASGVPLGQSAPVNWPVVFRIFPSATGGTSSWAERQTVTFDKGRYSVLLGAGAAEPNEPHGLLSTLVRTNGSGTQLFVETTVIINGVDATITPRLRLVASPYALLATRALNADSADAAATLTGNLSVSQLSGSLSGTNLVADSVTALQIANNAVTTSELANFSVTTLKLANDAVTSGKLTNGSVIGPKIADGAITAAKIGANVLLPNQIPSLDVSKITTGTFSADRLPATLARTDTANTFTGNQLVRGNLTVTNHLFVDTPGGGPAERVATGFLSYRLLAGAVRINGSGPKFYGLPNPTQTPTPVALDYQGGGFAVKRVLIDPSTNGISGGTSIVIGNYNWVAGCEIIFDEPFAAIPVMTVTASTDRGGSNGSSRFWTIPKVESTSPTNAVVTFFSPNNANVLDAAFHFIVVGQR